MSYILDALKKSEQQRQRGATPTLPAAQVTVAVRRPSMHVFLGVFAFALLGAGIVIGWLRPGAGEHAPPPPEAPPAAEPVAVKPQIAIAQLDSPSPLPVPSGLAGKTAPANQAPNRGARTATGVRTKGEAAGTTAAQGLKAVPMAELPFQIQQEVPAMAVQLHAYSRVPGERLVNINFRSLREGDYVTPELKLEQITPEGMIFSFRGYRFQRGIR